MIVTEKELIGKLEGFPLEVVQKMLEKQVEQGNEVDVQVFQLRAGTSKISGGFDWERTEEGYDFWVEVLGCRDFNLFFEKYPQTECKNKHSVSEEDLKGDLNGFPLEVVQKMIERQVSQGNYTDVRVFQEDSIYSRPEGGFSWEDTIEGIDFWEDVIADKKFEVFFEKYPKDNLKDYSNLVAKDLPTKVTLQDFIKEETNIVKDSLPNTFSTNIGEITLNSEIWHEYYGRGEVLKITKKEVEINFECKFNSCIFALTFTTDTDPKVYAKNNNRHISELKIIK